MGDRSSTSTIVLRLVGCTPAHKAELEDALRAAIDDRAVSGIERFDPADGSPLEGDVAAVDGSPFITAETPLLPLDRILSEHVSVIHLRPKPLDHAAIEAGTFDDVAVFFRLHSCTWEEAEVLLQGVEAAVEHGLFLSPETLDLAREIEAKRVDCADGLGGVPSGHLAEDIGQHPVKQGGKATRAMALRLFSTHLSRPFREVFSEALGAVGDGEAAHG